MEDEYIHRHRGEPCPDCVKLQKKLARTQKAMEGALSMIGDFWAFGPDREFVDRIDEFVERTLKEE